MSTPVIAPVETLPPVVKPAVDPEVERLQRQVASQDQTIKQMQNTMRMPAQPPAAPPAVDKKAAEKEFYANPLDASANIAHNVATAVTQRALNELGAAQYDTLKENASKLVRDKDPELFDKYETSIRAYVMSTPQQFHTNVNTWQIAFDRIKGENIREIAANMKPESNRSPAIHVSRGGGPAAPSVREPAAAPGEKLSEDESKWARNLGISEDSYKQGKEAYSNQSERGKSSWDGLITFSSKEKRAKERADRNKSKAAA